MSVETEHSTTGSWPCSQLPCVPTAVFSPLVVLFLWSLPRALMIQDKDCRSYLRKPKLRSRKPSSPSFRDSQYVLELCLVSSLPLGEGEGIMHHLLGFLKHSSPKCMLPYYPIKLLENNWFILLLRDTKQILLCSNQGIDCKKLHCTLDSIWDLPLRIYGLCFQLRAPSTGSYSSWGREEEEPWL